MKKLIASVILFVLSILIMPYEDVTAACASNQVQGKNGMCYTPETFINSGEGVCDSTNSYYNPTSIVVTNYTTDNKSAIVYDITKIKIDTSTEELAIYGWAFNKSVTNDLKRSDGTGIYDNNTADDSQIEMALILKDKIKGSTVEIPSESSPFRFNVQHAWDVSGDADAKFYNLTYWNCMRTNKNDVKDLNGANSGGMCMSNTTWYLWGGFKATVSLKDIREYLKTNDIKDPTYQVLMYVDSAADGGNNKTIGSTGKYSATGKEETWFPIGAWDGVAENLDAYKYNSNGETVTVYGLSDEAEVVVDQGRLIGSNGLYCSSPAAAASLNPSAVYFTQNEKYHVSGRISDAYRGPAAVSGATYYTQVIYQLDTSSVSSSYSKVKRGDTWHPYAPASWLSFTGELKITFGQPEEEPQVCPTGMEGPYYNYYLFAAGLNDETFANSVTFETSGSNSTYHDKEIFESLVKDTNEGYILNQLKILEEKEININSSNVTTFWQNMINSKNSSSGYYRSGDEFYITTSRWCSKVNGVEQACYDSGALKYSNPLDYARRSVYAKDKSVKRRTNASRDGYTFDVSRSFGTNKEFMANPAINSGSYYHPMEYMMAYCITKEEAPQCDDDVTAAECSGSYGTTAIFHENDDLKTCTLKSGTHSGFTIINNDDTSSYCEVACKDDIDIKLPTNKESAAGKYFTLDVYTNQVTEITGERTCITTKIDYSKLDDDLNAIESNIISEYNLWQDYYDIYSTLSGDPGSGSSTCTYSFSCDPCDSSGCSTCYEDYDYSYEDWTINSHTGPNGTSYGGDSGYWESSTPCSGGGTTYSSAYNSTKNRYSNLTRSARSTYYNTLQNYRDAINDYNKCYNWTDRTSNAKVTSNGSALNSSITLSVGSSYLRDDYRFTFYPTVSFTYDDKDNEVFGGTYTYEFQAGDITYAGDFSQNSTGSGSGYNFKPSLEVHTWYWQKDGTNDKVDYSQGYGSAQSGETQTMSYPYKVDRKLYNCTGQTCTTAHQNVSTYFYQSAYIKQTEKVSYLYHLPRISTLVPSGTNSFVNTYGKFRDYDVSENNLLLEEEAVPININTPEDYYNYSISITGVEDQLRQNSKSKSPDDDFEERFIGSKGKTGALNEGDEYVCKYRVISDIYNPDTKTLKFFYREIDMSNINPNYRQLGYNWTDSRANQVISIMQEKDNNYQYLTGMNNATYADAFEFTLSPSIMKEIRNYNKRQSMRYIGGYDDWDLTCTGTNGDNYHCNSTFLSCLASKGGSDYSACNRIFENNVLSSYNNSNYDYTKLNDNRNKLINKQASLP